MCVVADLGRTMSEIQCLRLIPGNGNDFSPGLVLEGSQSLSVSTADVDSVHRSYLPDFSFSDVYSLKLLC